jgi:hypothetical protein
MRKLAPGKHKLRYYDNDGKRRTAGSARRRGDGVRVGEGDGHIGRDDVWGTTGARPETCVTTHDSVEVPLAGGTLDAPDLAEALQSEGS